MFVVDFEPGLHGPFSTRRQALEWAHQQIGEHGEQGQNYGFCVVPIASPDEVPRAVTSS